jgi:hypothetical protein
VIREFMREYIARNKAATDAQGTLFPFEPERTKE